MGIICHVNIALMYSIVVIMMIELCTYSKTKTVYKTVYKQEFILFSDGAELSFFCLTLLSLAMHTYCCLLLLLAICHIFILYDKHTCHVNSHVVVVVVELCTNTV